MTNWNHRARRLPSAGRRPSPWPCGALARKALLGWVSGWALLAVGGFWGCQRSSPSEPSAPAPNANGLAVAFADDTGPLVPRFDFIRQHLESVHQSASRLLPIGGITGLVSSETDRLATGWGVAGGFQGGTMVEISIGARPQSWQ